MKICIISFDSLGYDAYIAQALKQKDIQATHIKIGEVTHSNFILRIVNSFSKVFLNKNLKHIKRQEFVINQLKKIGYQNQILVLNPNFFEDSTLEYMKKKCDRLKSFLYDNLERYPVEEKLHFFDKIFSFEDKDVEKYGFEQLTNYNYLSFLSQQVQNPQQDIVYLTSDDKKRLQQLEILSEKFKELQLRFKIFVIGKKAWRHKIKNLFLKKNIVFSRKRICLENAIEIYKDYRVILDLMRKNQYGLSFRIFEAMAMEKKIITDNPKIKQYDFYNPNNILVLNEDFSNLSKDFFRTPYQKLPQDIYQKYTLEHWVEYVFNL